MTVSLYVEYVEAMRVECHKVVSGLKLSLLRDRSKDVVS